MLSGGVQLLILNWDSNGCGNYFFFQDHYHNYDTVNNFSQFLFQLEKKCAENAAGEILLCNQALEAAINHKSPLLYHCKKETKLKFIQHLILCREFMKSFLCIMTLNSHNITKRISSLQPPPPLFQMRKRAQRGSGLAKSQSP